MFPEPDDVFLKTEILVDPAEIISNFPSPSISATSTDQLISPILNEL